MTPPPQQTGRKAFVSPRLAIGLVIVSALSLIAFLALLAYAPELRADRSGGANALSESAVGFAGLRFLVDNTGTHTRLDRLPPRTDADSLVILTPEAFTAPSELKALATPGPRLIVLPKWITLADPAHRGWVVTSGPYDGKTLARILSGITKNASIDHDKGVANVRLGDRYGLFERVIPNEPVKVSALQTISGPGLEPCILAGANKAVLVQIHGTQTYILSDPDLLNNMGVHDLAKARMAVDLIEQLRVGSKPVSFDLTLNGFRASPSILHSAFAPPFLGATLCAILAAAFIAMHALNRFGPPQTLDRAQAFGKQALADNTAAVIRLMHREVRMAPRYAEAMLDIVAGHAGVSRARAREASWLGALERRNGAPFRFSDLQSEAGAAQDIGGLMRVARKLDQWRRGIME